MLSASEVTGSPPSPAQTEDDLKVRKAEMVEPPAREKPVLKKPYTKVSAHNH
jgi:hypothetical protein